MKEAMVGMGGVPHRTCPTFYSLSAFWRLTSCLKLSLPLVLYCSRPPCRAGLQAQPCRQADQSFSDLSNSLSQWWEKQSPCSLLSPYHTEGAFKTAISCWQEMSIISFEALCNTGATQALSSPSPLLLIPRSNNPALLAVPQTQWATAWLHLCGRLLNPCLVHPSVPCFGFGSEPVYSNLQLKVP